MLILTLSLGVLAQRAGGVDAGGAREAWYVVELGGRKAGYVHRSVTEGRGRITTRSTTALTIRRDRATIELRLISEFVETAENVPVSMRAEQRMGALPDVTEYRFGPDGVEVLRGAGATRTRETRPTPDGEWLTPAAVDRLLAKAVADKSEKITYSAIDPLVGLEPLTRTHEVVGASTVRAMGKDVPAVQWTTTVDRYPGMSTTEHVDERGGVIRSVVRLGALELTLLRADRDLALAPGDAPELLNSTLITPDKPIERPRQAVRATYLVTRTDAELPDLPSTGAQTAERVDERSVRVRIDATAGSVPLPGDAGDATYLSPSVMIDSADPGVVGRARPSRGGAHQDPPGTVRASALRRAVHRLIDRKDLDVGFATASEVAKTLSGDCTEHAVLLAAMLRSQRIPARVVSGLVYVERPGAGGGGAAGGESGGVFGYHMWTQALVDTDKGDRWVDLDATLGPGVPTDATHIALVVSPLAEPGAGNDLVRLAPLIGTLKVGVESVETGPRIPQSP
jgi:transglutaminase-like putative cysteine protease